MSREKQIEEMEKLQDRLIKRSCSEYNTVTSMYLSEAARVIGTLIQGYRKQEWISVDERLPEETCECLAVSKFGTISLVNYSNRYKAFNATDDYDDGDRWKFSDITHWMPLPEAPKMKGGAE